MLYLYAREIWNDPLFNEGIMAYEYQNMKGVEQIIKDSIEFTIRQASSVKDILKNNLDTNEYAEQDDSIEKTKELKDQLSEVIDERNNENEENEKMKKMKKMKRMRKTRI